jgi:hypothetical protein
MKRAKMSVAITLAQSCRTGAVTRATRKARSARSLGRRAPRMSALRCGPLLFALLTTHCAAGASIRSAPNFSGVQLRRQSVLILPIAVSDDFGDERTGIILDRGTREEATRLACGSASAIRDDIVVTCFDDPIVAHSIPVSNDILSQFARDQPIASARWQELAQNTGARFAVLFRPENVTASHQVSSGISPAAAWTGALLLGQPLVSAMSGTSAMRGGPQHSATRGYTVSAVLVDLRGLMVVRAGSKSGEASNAGTEASNAGPLLRDIMNDLLKGLLDPH